MSFFFYRGCSYHFFYLLHKCL